MSVSDALKMGNELCGSSYVARELMKFWLNLNSEKLILSLNLKMQDEAGYENLCKQYKDGTPLEYITGVAHFLEDEFFVDERVLIPRFESEILVQKVLNIAQNLPNPKICEIGVGSGIIAVSLYKKLPNVQIYATDISRDALEVAKINASAHGACISFINCSLMDDVDGEFDIIVSNPPYICSSYPLDKWVLKEPKIALFGGETGDEILAKIIALASQRAKFLCCEIGYDQRQSLSKLLAQNGFSVEFYQDLAGFDRGFVAKNLKKELKCIP